MEPHYGLLYPVYKLPVSFLFCSKSYLWVRNIYYSVPALVLPLPSILGYSDSPWPSLRGVFRISMLLILTNILFLGLPKFISDMLIGFMFFRLESFYDELYEVIGVNNIVILINSQVYKLFLNY